MKTNETLTANGAYAFKSTMNNNLDLFGKGGASRNADIYEIQNLVEKALKEDTLTAIKNILYIGDIRGGQGERRFRRIALTYLANNYTDIYTKLVKDFPIFFRWDDIIDILFDVPFGAQVATIDVLREVLNHDLQEEFPTLLGKWMPSENVSSKASNGGIPARRKTKAMAKFLIEKLEMTPKTYRKMLVKLRSKIGIVEHLISNNGWKHIDYSKVPSKAMKMYLNAFKAHDPEGVDKFFEKVEAGEAKINVKDIFPYEIVHEYLYGGEGSKELDIMWSKLPDYTKGKQDNSLVVADVSGSMGSGLGDSKYTPLDVSISLALYIAQHNKGVFHNKFMTFSTNPQLVEVKGDSLREQIRNISTAKWNMSTNIDSMFQVIYGTAVQYQLTQDQLPKSLIIISDMQFDQGIKRETYYDKWSKKFAEIGYVIPQVIYWNVNNVTNVPMTMGSENQLLVSGLSPKILENVLENKFQSPVDFMMSVIDKPEYNEILKVLE